MKFGLIAVAGFILASPLALAANAQDPTQTPDHSGKQVDGKTNGVTPSTGEIVKNQDKVQPAAPGAQTLGGASPETPKN